MEQATATIAPATGKLGVLLPGMGAVSTTLIAGIELIKKGLGRPIGSLTQYGTVRLGKRTDNNTPLIKDFVPACQSGGSGVWWLGYLRR
jgi:myo-inositol-1-phosphate synthase